MTTRYITFKKASIFSTNKYRRENQKKNQRPKQLTITGYKKGIQQSHRMKKKNLTANREIFVPVLLSPLSLSLSGGEFKTRWIKNNFLNNCIYKKEYLHVFLNVSGQIQDEAKAFACVEGWKYHGGENNPECSMPNKQTLPIGNI